MFFKSDNYAFIQDYILINRFKLMPKIYFATGDDLLLPLQ